jgi:hypothetical protein
MILPIFMLGQKFICQVRGGLGLIPPVACYAVKGIYRSHVLQIQ